MYIVLDANALISDFTLSSPAFRMLFDGISRLAAKLCVSEVSLAEAARKYRQEVSSLLQAAQRLERLSGKQLNLAALTKLDDLVADYRRRVSERFVVLSLPAITHADVIARILAQRSPSRTDERGYRDTLIWETVLERLSADGSDLLLVTADGDFSDKEGRPHADLLADMAGRGISEERLTIYKALSLLNRDRIEPLLAAEKEYERLLKEDAFPNFSLRTWFEAEIPPYHLSQRLRPARSIFSSEPEIEIDEMEVSDVTVTDVRNIEGSNIYVQAEATFSALYRLASDFIHEREARVRDFSEFGSWRSYPRDDQRDGNFVAYAELVLRSDGEVVSAELYGIDKLA